MSETKRMTDDAIVWRADAEDGGSVWVHANGEWGHEGGAMSWALDAVATKIAADARASEGAKDKEIERLKSELGAAEGLIATLNEQQAQVRESTLAAFSDRDAEAEQLKAVNAVLLQFVRGHAEVVCEDVVRQCGECDSCIARTLVDVIHPGTALLEELTRLRAQVATLVAGQQRNGEARQQARLDMAHELAEMEPALRDATIRRIIDSHEGR